MEPWGTAHILCYWREEKALQREERQNKEMKELPMYSNVVDKKGVSKGGVCSKNVNFLFLSMQDRPWERSLITSDKAVLVECCGRKSNWKGLRRNGW